MILLSRGNKTVH